MLNFSTTRARIQLNLAEGLLNFNIMIPVAAGAAIGAVGNIVGAFGAGAAARRQRKRVEGQLRENEDLFNKDYYQDYSQRSDAQHLLTNMREFAKSRYRVADNTAAITGASPEAAALQKRDATDALGDAVANLSASADAQKESVKDRYLDTKSALNQQMGQLDQQQGAAWSEIGQQAGALGGALMNPTPSK